MILLRKHLYVAFIGLLGVIFSQTGVGQSVLDPNDPIVTYNAATPPTQPPSGQIGKWVRTKRLNWNTDAYKAYIYKGAAFRLKFPKTYDPVANDGKRYPMIIMFHGRGERAAITDNEYQLLHGGQIHLNAVNAGTFDGYVLFMQNTGGFWGNGYYDYIKELIDYMVVNNKVDLMRLSFHGLSAGGQATWEFMQRYPKYVAGSLPMSGVSVGYKDDNALKQNMKYTPIWYFQGGLDGSPAPNTAIQVVDAFRAVGANIKYTVYPNLGHGVWNTAYAEADFFPFMMRAHKANPWPLFGRADFCPGDPININIGVSPGFQAYEWRKDGVLIPGAVSNQINVTTTGTYDCRIRIDATNWSSWSPIPLVVRVKPPTVSPNIQVSGLASKVIPSLDGKTSVVLEIPTGFESYNWQKVGASGTLSTANTLNATTPGDYHVRVTEVFGCSSEFSAPFTVINADGPNKPDPAINLAVTTLSKTSLRLDWSDNPSPAYNETNFEVYRSSTENGSYTLIAIKGADVTSHVVDGLNPNTTYFFKVRAVNNFSASAASNVASGVTAADLVPPTAPVNLRVVGTTRSSISVDWDPATDDVGVTKYDVYINGKKSFVTSNTDFVINNLVQGATYNIQVVARDFANNSSPLSNQVSDES